MDAEEMGGDDWADYETPDDDVPWGAADVASLSAASTGRVGAVMTREEVIALLDRAMRERVDAARKRDEAEREAYADELCDDKDADS